MEHLGYCSAEQRQRILSVLPGNDIHGALSEPEPEKVYELLKNMRNRLESNNIIELIFSYASHYSCGREASALCRFTAQSHLR